jgi:ferredoxin
METEHDTCYQVVFDLPSGEVTIQVRSDEFILDAARRAELDLPSLCERGWCMTCATRIADRQAGFALICTARPRSDLRLRPYAVETMRAHRDAHHLPAPRGTGSE